MGTTLDLNKRSPAPLSANALAVLERRYLRRDAEGNVVETPDEMFHRVASAVTDDAQKQEVFYQRMAALEFLPNSPALMNAGTDLGQLAACFVVPVEDSTPELFQAVGWAAQIQKTGGGTGFAFSRLRPSGDRVASTGGVASGPVSFMQVFDSATDAIKQGGTRRGANMGVLRVDHPDILAFIALKLDGEKMQNFNLSVGVTDEFMAAVKAGGDYALRNPRSGQEVRTLSAPRVFELLCNAAWSTGDPGVVFLDRINERNPTPMLGDIEATNPCGEQPLLPFESCTLGSINLLRFVADGDFEWDRFASVVRDAVEFLDLVVDANKYPLAEIETATLATRKIGLGVMGLADALIAMGVPYAAPEAVAFADQLASRLKEEAAEASHQLALAHGAFPAFQQSRWAKGEWGDARPRRNATTTTVAPTGTIAIIAGCSSGIEPLFGVAHERRALDGEIFTEVHSLLRFWAEKHGVWSDELLAGVRATGTLAGTDVPEEMRELFRTAHEIPYGAHVRMQAAFQGHIDAAVSKTINLPHDATQRDVAGAYQLAYDLGCKGVTVFRDGSRDEQVLAVSQPRREPSGPTCAECGGALVTSERCRVCLQCGFSYCQ